MGGSRFERWTTKRRITIAKPSERYGDDREVRFRTSPKVHLSNRLCHTQIVQQLHVDVVSYFGETHTPNIQPYSHTFHSRHLHVARRTRLYLA